MENKKKLRKSYRKEDKFTKFMKQISIRDILQSMFTGVMFVLLWIGFDSWTYYLFKALILAYPLEDFFLHLISLGNPAVLILTSTGMIVVIKLVPIYLAIKMTMGIRNFFFGGKKE